MPRPGIFTLWMTSGNDVSGDDGDFDLRLIGAALVECCDRIAGENEDRTAGVVAFKVEKQVFEKRSRGSRAFHFAPNSSRSPRVWRFYPARSGEGSETFETLVRSGEVKARSHARGIAQSTGAKELAVKRL